ncbi:hypothetical protein HTVC035P_gp28 [Pelagibacter phage HTVC035P]|nr:hypothetical protein [Candidatus Woesearchaeota archaeon]QPZ53525.1 hypothetical protein HTVC035P_gp28 [Pelagibacter phage HTVC035P]|tara:strand:+ start:98 stop:514 length:417 start_codon:yes stop_codon:yes gene_type:complete
MKIRKYKIPTWFITEELHHKVGISYDHETKRAYDLLDIMSDKYWKIDRRKKFNRIEVTEEEYQTWYVYFLEYYIDDESIYKGTKEYKEAKKLLDRMINFFGIPNFNMNHRAGTKMRFVRTLFKTGVAQKIIKGNDTIN